MSTEPDRVSAERVATTSGMKVPILLVDDRASDLVALEAVLASPEYELVTASSGQDALQVWEEQDFAVVLLDLNMPQMDGFETALQMKRRARNARPSPIIFVTAADADRSNLARAYEGGAVDFVQKPVVPEVLRSKVWTFAELYRARRHLFVRLQALTALALDLSKARTPDEVVTVVVEQGKRASQADTCTLHMMDETGTSLSLVDHYGVAPEVVELIRSIDETTANPGALAAVKRGESLWVESEADYARIYPHLESTKAQGARVRAFWSVPLIAEGRTVGLLGMGFYDARTFPPEERSFIETLATQCAQALVRAVRLDREEEARAWLATTLLSIGDAVIATDGSGRITLMNAVAERLTGWDAAEARGRPLDGVFSIFSEETRNACESPVDRVLREGTVVGLANHTVLRSKHGVEIPVDDSAAPIRDAKGNLFGVVLVFRDASEEKRNLVRRDFLARAGAALVSSIDYRATLATVAQLAVPQLADWWAVDIVEATARVPQQVAVAHVDPQKVELGRALRAKYPPDPNAPTGVAEVIRTGVPELYSEIPPALLESRVRDAEYLQTLRDLKFESAMIIPLRGRERTLGAMTFVYAGSGRQYTQDDLAFAEEFARRCALAIENALALKQAEDARAEERGLRREADIANRAKDEFLATVSHELRTPLNAILGWTVTLRSRRPPPDVDRGLGIVERNARRQLRLVEDVLDVSRIISGKLALTLGPANIGEIVGGAIESVLPAAQAKGVTIDADLEAESPITITADSDRLHQVMWNLLANAVKFSAKGGRVSVKSFRQGSDVCVRVTDTGVGIASDVIPYVFDPFRQADASTTRIHGGLGLGLAIVKQLVVAHGGTVRAQSEGEGRGATFTVTLPAIGVVRAVSEPPSAPGALPGAVAAAAPRLEGLTVLVVDDEEDALLLVEELLCERGAKVTAVRSAPEALAALENSKPDVIVSDIGMPEMDGYALLRQIRALPVSRGGRTPAIALTAYARREDAQRAFAAGFQMHVSKPADPVQLATIVANLGGRTME
jgi:PAS domain S-box-containing protein